MKSNWIVRSYQEGDEDRILSLFPSENKFRTMEWWQWHYKRNPAGDAIIWVVEDGDEIIAHMSWIPMKIELFSKKIIAGRAGDARTRAEYRRQGIFRELILNGHDSAIKEGWSLFIGLANENSHPGLIKSGWLDVCKIPSLVRVLQPGRVSHVIGNEGGRGLGTAVNIISRLSLLGFPKRRKTTFKNDLTIVEEKGFDKNYDDFWERVSPYLKIAIIRNSEYLNWRYRDNPIYQYTSFAVRKNKKILGYTVVGCYREKYNIGRILEFLVLPDQFYAAEMLLEQANYFFTQKNIDIIQCMAQNSLLPKTLYRKYGYIKNPLRGSNFVVCPLTTDMETNVLTTSRNWLISFGTYGTS